MAEAAVKTEKAMAGVPGVEEGPRVAAGDDWISDMKGDKEGDGAPPADKGQAPRGSAPKKPDRWARIVADRATSASDDSGDLVEMLRGFESGLGEDRALQAAEVVGALFSAPGGMSARENAGLVVKELARAGVDVGRMLAAIAEVSARDRTEVAARELQDSLKEVLGLVHRMAAATTSRVGAHLSGFDERAQGVLTSALMAQAVLERLEPNVRRVIARVDEVQKATENLTSVVTGAEVEVRAAATAAEGWVESAGVLGRGVWWWAFVGGVLGGGFSGMAAGFMQRVVAGL